MPSAERRIEPRADVRWRVRIHHPTNGCVEGEVSKGVASPEAIARCWRTGSKRCITYPIQESIRQPEERYPISYR